MKGNIRTLYGKHGTVWLVFINNSCFKTSIVSSIQVDNGDGTWIQLDKDTLSRYCFNWDGEAWSLAMDRNTVYLRPDASDRSKILFMKYCINYYYHNFHLIIRIINLIVVIKCKKIFSVNYLLLFDFYRHRIRL